MSEELKPCPFCGKTHEPREINDHYGIFYALCCDYQIMVSWRSEPSRREAYAMWNTRPIEDELRARAEAAEAEAAKLRKVIVGMLPMWISAMGYCEHGKNSQLMFMRNYYNGRENKMTNEDIHLMFSVMPGEE